MDGDATLNLTDPILGASAVIGYQGWLAGYQLGYEVKTSVLKNNNFALGYTAGDFVLHTSV